MSDCCTVPLPTTKSHCPISGTLGKPVKLITLKSLLLEPAKARLDRNQDHFFCPAPSCSIVYYSGTGGEVYSAADLSVPVWQKASTDPGVPVCYCFSHTKTSIAEELQQSGKSTVVANIAAKVKAGLCDCEERNPQGSCCLGNVTTVVNLLKNPPKRSDSSLL